MGAVSVTQIVVECRTVWYFQMCREHLNNLIIVVLVSVCETKGLVNAAINSLPLTVLTVANYSNNRGLMEFHRVTWAHNLSDDSLQTTLIE